MKDVLRVEELGLFLLFTIAYFYFYENGWVLFLALFFVPDISFMLYLISPKAGAIAYNILHHKGVMGILLLLGLFLQVENMVKIGMIFLAHSNFDRALGYGLKYFDHFDHTHLGWIGKSKHKNVG